jgi:hypothetical protein
MMNNRTFLIEKGETMGVCFALSFLIVERACGRFHRYQGFIDFTPAGGNCRVKKHFAGLQKTVTLPEPDYADACLSSAPPQV